MYFTLFAAAAIAPVVLATPQAYGYGHERRREHHHHYRPSGAPFSTGGALPTGGASTADAGIAPYGFGNGTAGPGSTGFATRTQVLGTTVRHTVYATVPAPSQSVIESPNEVSSAASLLNSLSGVQSASVNEAVAGSVGSCNAGTVTTTYNPTFTVTVTPSQADTGVASTLVSISATNVGSQGVSAESSSPETKPSVTPTTASRASPESLSAGTESGAFVSPSSPVSSSAAAVQPVSPSANSRSTPSVATSSPAPSTSQAQSSVTVQPTKAATTTASAHSVPSPKPAAGGKRGILASGPDQDALVSAFDNSSKITWLCNWYSAPPQNLGSHIEFVPQDYGKESNTAPKHEWTTNAKQAIARGTKYFLGFGEPEAPNTPTMHTNMDPQDAVTLFMKDLQPYAEQGINIGAPAVLQPDPDLAWLKQFLGLCDTAGCKISFIAIHWVWKATPAERVQDFKDTVNNAIAMANGKKVWVDNFQASGTNAEQQQWLSQVLPWLESNDAVERYAYVSPSRATGTGFLNADGSMSSLGEYYANF